MPTDTRKPRKEPEVVVFDQSRTTPMSQTNKLEYKAFMSSKISKINAKPKPRTKAEVKEDKEDKLHDRNLKALLEGKLMIEQLHESQLSGKERHKHNTEKLKRLGMKIKTKDKMPADMFFATQRNREERAQRAIKDAQDRGVLNAAVRRELERKHTGKTANEGNEKRFKSKERGPNSGPGKFKDGVLHISKGHIDRISGAKASGRVGKMSAGKGKKFAGKGKSGGKKKPRR
ncbi:hypothetical protein EV180_004295 [Coemansia sp. RSA 518]|nr:hypothetical protein EV180_004295 [Coemansia sp. RSA 518]KAJ2246147.1 hypothetical protein GGH98_004380 [Coemansia sp. RSA 454]KAJ2434026.1 hypothetical protein IWW41_001711 [Coemansia sp. RSA 2522]KAJ2592692.1 hypothetical protein IWW49_000894 [Coemansia sp. RSA 1797]KAJ2722710.1 hypothetical protein H4S00_002671 [Coemansia sp. D1744]